MRKESRPRLSGKKKVNHDYFNSKSNRVLCIGDIHSPFDRTDYLNHLIETYQRFNCNKVVFLGDVIDSHFSSYHETSANGLGGGDELALAIKKIAPYYKAFPKAVVLWGNHDRMVMRKAQTSGIPVEWIRDISEVLQTPGWTFMMDYYLDGVRYTHGDGSGKAKTACVRDMQSTVTGHFHTELYVSYHVGINTRVFGLAVGCGIDDSSYAMGYAKGGKKSAIGCGVVLDGVTAIAVPMRLEEKK